MAESGPAAPARSAVVVALQRAEDSPDLQAPRTLRTRLAQRHTAVRVAQLPRAAVAPVEARAVFC